MFKQLLMVHDLRLKYNDLINRVDDLEAFFKDLNNEKLPNGWLLVSGITDLFDKRQLTFSKSLVSDDDLLDLLLKYSNFGFSTDKSKSNYVFVDDGLFSYDGPKSLKEELEIGVVLMNKPKYYNGKAVITWNSLSHELLKSMNSIGSGYVRGKEAMVWLKVPIDCPNFIEYLI